MLEEKSEAVDFLIVVGSVLFNIPINTLLKQWVNKRQFNQLKTQFAHAGDEWLVDASTLTLSYRNFDLKMAPVAILTTFFSGLFFWALSDFNMTPLIKALHDHLYSNKKRREIYIESAQNMEGFSLDARKKILRALDDPGSELNRAYEKGVGRGLAVIFMLLMMPVNLALSIRNVFPAVFFTMFVDAFISLLFNLRTWVNDYRFNKSISAQAMFLNSILKYGSFGVEFEGLRVGYQVALILKINAIKVGSVTVARHDILTSLQCLFGLQISESSDIEAENIEVKMTSFSECDRERLAKQLKQTVAAWRNVKTTSLQALLSGIIPAIYHSGATEAIEIAGTGQPGMHCRVNFNFQLTVEEQGRLSGLLEQLMVMDADAGGAEINVSEKGLEVVGCVDRVDAKVDKVELSALLQAASERYDQRIAASIGSTPVEPQREKVKTRAPWATSAWNEVVSWTSVATGWFGRSQSEVAPNFTVRYRGQEFHYVPNKFPTATNQQYIARMPGISGGNAYVFIDPRRWEDEVFTSFNYADGENHFVDQLSAGVSDIGNGMKNSVSENVAGLFGGVCPYKAKYDAHGMPSMRLFLENVTSRPGVEINGDGSEVVYMASEFRPHS